METGAMKIASGTSPLRDFFREDKCAQRRRIAANREGVEAAPVRFLGEGSDGRDAIVAPLSNAEALELIAERVDPAYRLRPRDVYIHWIEAASSRFIADRYAFLSESTLRNIAAAANAGVAFMNSHATGSLSGPPAQLPFGRTFYGAFEPGKDGGPSRTIVGLYMLAGEKPNGDAGPSTDALDAAIRARTIFDVSVGLGGGDVLCGVCGQNWSDLEDAPAADAADMCDHYPGTRHGMTKEQIAAALAAGVTKGRASYIIDNATFSEVSAVYDGAVPGAGFGRIRSAMSHLSSRDRAELREALGDLFNDFEGGSMRKKTRFEPAAEDPEEKPAEETEDAAGDPEETPAEDPKPEDGEEPGEPAVDAAPAAPPMPPEGEPDGDEPEDEEDDDEDAPAEGGGELARLRQENAKLRASAFSGTLGEKLGANALGLAGELHVALAGHPEILRKFEAFCAALPALALAKSRVGATSRDLVADLAQPGGAEHAAHRAALKELRGKGIRPGTAEWGRHYNDAITRLRASA